MTMDLTWVQLILWKEAAEWLKFELLQQQKQLHQQEPKLVEEKFKKVDYPTQHKGKQFKRVTPCMGFAGFIRDDSIQHVFIES